MEKVYFFLNSYAGMFITQSVLHSAVAAVLADCCIAAWGITAPNHRQSLRIGVILIPILAFPVYQLLDPERGTIYFRLDALMDSGGWLLMKLWGYVPVIAFLVLVLGLTVIVFLFQELLPVVGHTAGSFMRRGGEGDAADEEDVELPETYDRSVLMALESMPGEKPDVVVIEDEDLVVFSSTGRIPAVYVSTGLVDTLDSEQLRGAIAHEIAHIRRTRRPVLTFLFVFRMLMFFNPVALFEFRRAVQDEEEICDDEAVRATGNPAALSSALERFLEDDGHEHTPEGSVGRIEEYSHDMQIRNRIKRLMDWDAGAAENEGRMFLPVFVLSTLVLNYFIV
jgi:Zn-dependent protease with chaperone function